MDHQIALNQINEIILTIKGRVGVAARSLDGFSSLEINADEIFPTASTMKVPVL